MSIVIERARAAINRHGSLRKAARAMNVNATVLQLLASGKRLSASPRTLRALGLKAKRVVEVVDAALDDRRQSRV